MRGHYQKVCKKAAFAGALSKSWQSGGGIHPLGGQPADAHCDHSKHSEATKPGGRIFRKPLNFFLYEISIHQVLKISQGPIWFSLKIFSHNVSRDNFPWFMKTLQRKVFWKPLKILHLRKDFIDLGFRRIFIGPR